MTNNKKITIAFGDGIGPEIMNATLSILKAANARIEYDVIEIGEHLYNQGVPAGIEDRSWDSLRETKVFLKAPITTPQGKGVKSLNVTIRKSLGLFANVRPCISFAPFIHTRHGEMNVAIIRENEEDLYGGIEHQQTPEVVQTLKLFSLPGCQRIIRFAFEYAQHYNRKKITCMTKDNIMKMTDGMFHRVFDQIAKEYPDIESEHMIIDIGSALLADRPEQFDTIVLPNLYGDILSDIAAQIAGSVGLAGSANIGDECAMFEAIHGSAPDIAGKNIANPSGLIHASIMMLVHIGQPKIAETIHNAWLCTIEEGIHTADIYEPSISEKKVGTKEFANAVIERLEKTPQIFSPVRYPTEHTGPIHSFRYQRNESNPLFSRRRTLVGVDIFLYWEGNVAHELAHELEKTQNPRLTLTMISNRGTTVWPKGHPETFCTDHWRCRFYCDRHSCSPQNIIDLLQELHYSGFDVIKTENLYYIDGEPAYSKAQGEA